MENHIAWKNRIFPIIGAIIVFALCFCVLYAGDNVGLSDNGDFRRVLLVNNLEYRNDTNHYYLFKQDYIMKLEGDTFGEQLASTWSTDEENNIYASPHFILIKASKSMNFLANCIMGRKNVSRYNIAWLAGIYIFMLSLAAWGIFTFFQDMSRKLQITVFALFIFIFCDAGYILYFNSFYGEPLQYVALMLLISVGLLMYKRPSIPKAISFYTALYFFAGAKLVNIPYAIILGLLAVCTAFLRKDKMFKISVAASAAISLGLIISLSAVIPKWMTRDTTYQSVFYGITKDSDDPAKDLRELGVPDRYAVLASTHAYMEEEEYPVDVSTLKFRREFYGAVSKLDIAFFYLRHPIRLFDKLCVSIRNSAYIRPPNLGNSSVKIMEMTNRFSLWSNLRVFLKFMYNPAVLFILFSLLTVYAIFITVYTIRRRKEKNANTRIYVICGLDVLLLGLWINLALPVMGNGEADIAKHMYLFINYVDILFAVLVIAIINMKRRNIIASAVLAATLAGVLYISPSNKTIVFGTYEGKPLEWEIVNRLEDNSLILITKKNLGKHRFDAGSNNWENSELRQWLNSEFLKEFTDEEKSKIKPTQNEIILSYNDKGLSVGGDHTHYWNFTREQAGELSETAYHYYLEDMVYIPTLDMLKNVNYKSSYWVLCPYASNDKMERYMKYDGFILHTNVNNYQGVRAVIKYDGRVK